MGWAIFGGIVGGVALVVFALLMLPVRVVFKTKKDGTFQLYYRILCISFGKKSKPNSPAGKAFEKLFGLSQFKNAKSAKENTHKESLEDRVRRLFQALTSLVKRAVGLLKHCTVSWLHLQVICAGEDAAVTAIEYGAVSGVVYSLYGYLESVTKIRKRATEIEIACDYAGGASKVSLEAVLSFPLHRIIKALLDIIKDNMKKESYR